MNPDSILKIVLPRCPEGFQPVCLLETEVAATSLIKRAWILYGGEWRENSLEFDDLEMRTLANSAKIKFFIKGDDLHCFVNDKGVKYFDHFVVQLMDRQFLG